MHVGELILVYKKHIHGWWVGKKINSEAFGYFPNNYVVKKTSAPQPPTRPTTLEALSTLPPSLINQQLRTLRKVYEDSGITVEILATYSTFDYSTFAAPGIAIQKGMRVNIKFRAFFSNIKSNVHKEMFKEGSLSFTVGEKQVFVCLYYYQ